MDINNSNCNMKDNKGITLIALIITIIVLLVVVGISLARITKDDSAPAKAVEARRETKKGEAKDVVALLITSYTQDYYNDKYVKNTTTANNLGEYINSRFLNENGLSDGFITKGDYKIKIENGNLTVNSLNNNTIMVGRIDSNGEVIIDDSNEVNTDPEPENPTENQNVEIAKINETDKEIVYNVASFQDLIPTASYTPTILPSEKNVKIVKGEGETQQQIIIPAGFAIASDSGTTIEEGLVIQDMSRNEDGYYTKKYGNQFVWIPVEQTLTYSDTYNNSSLKVAIGEEGTSGKISLSRYYFGSSSAPEFTMKGGSEAINDRYTETSSNSIARDIEDFKTKTIAAKGYYIGRYEIGQSSDAYSSIPVSKAGKKLYGSLTCSEASQKAKDFYGIVTKDNTNLYASDLVNSFAWDTAVAFIEKCGTNSNYAFKSTSGGSGLTGSSSDEQCKINDMGGNVSEWRTEYYYAYNKYGDYGNCVIGASGTTVSRSHCESSVKSAGGFRAILYIL